MARRTILLILMGCQLLACSEPSDQVAHGVTGKLPLLLAHDFDSLDRFGTEELSAALSDHGDTLLHLVTGSGNILYDWEERTRSSDSHLGEDIQSVRYLLLRGVNPNLENSNGTTPIFSAVSNGRLDTVELLIEFEADINIHNEFKKSPLDYALLHCRTSVAEYLIKKGAKATGDQLNLLAKCKK